MCGDSYINGTLVGGVPLENCDDGNNVTETCQYNMGGCTVCRAGCTSGPGITQACNDGIVQASQGEVCDDGNASCGTCSNNCQVFSSAKATGSLSVVRANDMTSGDNFTLNDGYHNAVTFEYRTSGAATAGHILISVSGGDNSTSVRGTTVSAINAGPVTIAAAGATWLAGVATFTTTANHKLAAGGGGG